MRRFKLVRHKDISGVSGTGDVAEGIQFTDGSVALRWHGDHPATAVWPSVEDVMAVHGHGGDTELIWIDGHSNTLARGVDCASCFRLRKASPGRLCSTPEAHTGGGHKA